MKKSDLVVGEIEQAAEAIRRSEEQQQTESDLFRTLRTRAATHGVKMQQYPTVMRGNASEGAVLSLESLARLLDKLDQQPAALITHRGLAAQFGKSEAWMRHLMKRADCPVSPVAVEGGDRAAIYPKEQAMEWVARQLAWAEA